METNGEVSRSRKSLRSVQRSEGLPTDKALLQRLDRNGTSANDLTLPNLAIISPASFFAQMPVAYSYSNEGKVTSLTINLC